MKKFLSLVLVLSIFANNSIVYAYDDKKPASENDITTWRQSDAIWSENSKTYLNEDLKEYLRLFAYPMYVCSAGMEYRLSQEYPL